MDEGDVEDVGGDVEVVRYAASSRRSSAWNCPRRRRKRGIHRRSIDVAAPVSILTCQPAAHAPSPQYLVHPRSDKMSSAVRMVTFR